MRFHRKIKPFFVDERGEMSHLLDDEIPIVSAVLITNKKGAIRANHYHKKDTHYVYMISGSMEYTYKDSKKPNAKKRTIIIKTGDVVVSPPNIMHAMYFLEDSVFLALTTERRNSKRYEKDTVRIKLI